MAVVHGITHHGKTGLVIRLALEHGRGLLNVERPVQLVRVSREEAAQKHQFLHLIVRQINFCALFQNVLHAVAGVTGQGCLRRNQIVLNPGQCFLLFLRCQFTEMRVIVLRFNGVGELAVFIAVALYRADASLFSKGIKKTYYT